MTKSGLGLWALVFFILTGLVGLILIGLGSWMLLEPARFSTKIANTPTIPVQNGAADESLLLIITATLDPTLTPHPALNPDSGTDQPGQASQPAATAASSPTNSAGEAWDACPGAYLSHLRVGQKAMVSLNPPLPNNVRDQASKSGKFLFAIQPGDVIDIIDGPGCSNGWVWWKIQAADGQSGWTAEGDGTDYWIVLIK